jgi:glucose uptake protein GlcU
MSCHNRKLKDCARVQHSKLTNGILGVPNCEARPLVAGPHLLVTNLLQYLRYDEWMDSLKQVLGSAVCLKSF